MFIILYHIFCQNKLERVSKSPNQSRQLNQPAPKCRSGVMSHKNVTNIVWYIKIQLSSLNNTMSMVSTNRGQRTEYRGQNGRFIFHFFHLSSDLCLLLPDT